MFLRTVVKKIWQGVLNTNNWLGGDTTPLFDADRRFNVERLAILKQAHFVVR
jgi:hypothetical protein